MPTPCLARRFGRSRIRFCLSTVSYRAVNLRLVRRKSAPPATRNSVRGPPTISNSAQPHIFRQHPSSSLLGTTSRPPKTCAALPPCVLAFRPPKRKYSFVERVRKLERKVGAGCQTRRDAALHAEPNGCNATAVRGVEVRPEAGRSVEPARQRWRHKAPIIMACRRKQVTRVRDATL